MRAETYYKKRKALLKALVTLSARYIRYASDTKKSFLKDANKCFKLAQENSVEEAVKIVEKECDEELEEILDDMCYCQMIAEGLVGDNEGWHPYGY